ncbi:MAG: ABC transporter permease [Dehalococcoidia bacterium]
MRRFIIRRMIFAVLTVIAATGVVFFLSRAAGDPLLLYATPGYGLTPDQEVALREALDLDHPVVVQYFLWLGRAVRGDLGRTILDQKPVSRIVTERIPASVHLGAAAWLFATVVGVPLGVLSAVKRGTAFDYLGRSFALMGQALPAFWLGLVLILVVAELLGWLPVSGRGNGFWDVKHVVLPAFTLGVGAMAGYLRLTRNSMLEILDSEFVKLARAKGVASQKVIWKHAFRNALIQPLTASTLILAGFLTGSVVVESIFAWPGLGLMAITAVRNNDFPLLQGIVLMLTILYVFMTFVTDILYAYIDPRIRYD